MQAVPMQATPLAANQIIRAAPLALEGVSHAFFTREGGVSQNVYATLNGGVGSRDKPGHVAQNRARMAATLGVAPDRLLVPFQIHSPDAIIVNAPWPQDERPRCDGIATATPGLGLGVTGADCGTILFADSKARVIGACHSGWKGALTGVLEATLGAMEKLGARRADVHCVLGPAIAQKSYEVGTEFIARFTETDKDYTRFFIASEKTGHAMFDLPGFIGMRLARTGIGSFLNLDLDTYSNEERFYSYRRSVHRGEPDYGRLVAGIALV